MILRERIDRIEIIRINRPEARNAINTKVNHALADAFDELEKDRGVAAIILTGVGDKAFCAGVDLKEVNQLGNEDVFRQASGGFAGIVQRTMPQVLIAAVNGFAIGGGLEIMLACDLAVASETATFGSPEAYLGILADGGAMVRLPRQLPLPIAKEILLLGERFPASRAYELGLVNRVVPQAQVMDIALAMARRVCEGAPISLRITKNMIDQGRHVSWDEAWKMNARASAEVEQTKDSLEGPRAFTETRAPNYQGH
jgi:enoyl-CoA hydratase/carnithine racemase